MKRIISTGIKEKIINANNIDRGLPIKVFNNITKTFIGFVIYNIKGQVHVVDTYGEMYTGVRNSLDVLINEYDGLAFYLIEKPE